MTFSVKWKFYFWTEIYALTLEERSYFRYTDFCELLGSSKLEELKDDIEYETHENFQLQLETYEKIKIVNFP